MDFSTFIARVYAEVRNKNSTTLDDLKRITVRQLKELSATRTLFMEGSASFSLGIGSPYLGEYADSTVTGFPKDVRQIDSLWYLTGTARTEVCGPKSMQEIRFYDSDPTVVAASTYPDIWAWFSQKLWVAPKLSAARTLYLDYFKDATLDTASGVAISESSTTQTNPWFDRGELVLRYAVLGEYFSLPASRDPEAASAALGQRNVFRDTLYTEYQQTKGMSFQAPCAWGG